MRPILPALVCACLVNPVQAATHAAHPAPSQISELPVGDGRVSDAPRLGYVFACNTGFRQGGARHVGGWFHGDTWNPLEKPHVRGRVMWSEAAFDLSQEGQRQRVVSNGLPVGQPTGAFPIDPSDPVFAFDTNPNPIRPQTLDFRIPAVPTRAEQPGCLPMGMIGFTLTGVALYNALDDAGNDAAAHEVQDLCNGHPQGKGQYHYHNSSPCLPGADRNAVVGWALDGYPILGSRDSQGRPLGNTDLDVCHGRKEDLLIDGRRYDYAYRMTAEYPYIIGCFSGQQLPETRQSIRKSMGPPRERRGGRGPGMAPRGPGL